MKSYVRCTVMALLLITAAGLSAMGLQDSLELLGMRNVEQSLRGSLSERGHLTIETRAAGISISRGSAGEEFTAALTGHASDPITLHMEENQGSASLYTTWKRQAGTTTRNLQLTVRVPDDFTGDLTIRTASGGFTLTEGRLGALVIENASGPVRLDGVTAESVRIDNASGGISLSGLRTENLRVNTLSGALRAELVGTPAVQASAASGAVSITGEIASARLSSVAGALSLRLERLTGSVTAESVSGAIRIELPGRNEYGGEVSSLSGNIRVDLGSERIERRGQSVIWGDRTAGQTIQASSVSGAITVTD